MAIFSRGGDITPAVFNYRDDIETSTVSQWMSAWP